ncbi:MAG: hypothetical protein Q8S44_05105 [Flavobacteriaceae bacterium]|nr:hypothetical protein [Flavobacteriaceae bacterium]
MDLLNLGDYITNLGIDPSEEHLEMLFQLFKTDFLEQDIYLDDHKIIIDTNNSKEEGFENYPHTFVKLITRGEKRKRVFDKKRANKLHWVKAIIENKHANDIICFKFLEGDGSIKDYYWFKEGGFLIIIKKITPNCVIVSSFHIDDKKNQEYYERKYNNRIK